MIFPGRLAPYWYSAFLTIPEYQTFLITIDLQSVYVLCKLKYSILVQRTVYIFLQGYEGVESAIQDLFQHTVQVTSNAEIEGKSDFCIN